MTTRERGIIGRVTEGVQSLVQGYSRQEAETAIRILEEGVITDRDRTAFVNGRFNRIAGLSMLFMPSIIDQFGTSTLISPRELAQAREEETRLRQLWRTDPTVFDAELTDDWREKATAWRLNLTSSPLLPQE